MAHYDLHVVYEEGEFERLAREAKLLGFFGLGVEVPARKTAKLCDEVVRACERAGLECFFRIDVNELGALRKVVNRVGRGRVLVSYTHHGDKVDITLARKVDVIDLRGPVDRRSLRKIKNVNPHVAFEVQRRYLVRLLRTEHEKLLVLLESLRKVLESHIQIIATSGAAKWYQLVPPLQLSYSVATLLEVEEEPKRFTQLALRAIFRLMEGDA